MPFYVITGGPCVGKTSVIDELRKRGLQIIPEFARIVIEEGKYLPWIDLYVFQKEVNKRQIEAESKANGHKVFCDRGLADSIAYQRLGGLVVEEQFIAECKSRYEKVFLLEPLPFYQNDQVRKEDPETALRIHQEIERAYRDLDYKVINIPPIGIEQRVELILRETQDS